ncbi:hypothetical protein COOONC_07285 [Cooperia oncophora]
MMYMFLSPMLWAVLVGTVLFPFKKNVTNAVQGWLDHLHETNTPLVVGVMAMPVCALKSFSEKVYSTAVRVYVLSSISLYFGVFKAAVFSGCAVVLGLLSAGVWAVDDLETPDEGQEEEVTIESESETAKLIENPHEGDTTSVVSLHKAIGSDSMILIVAGLCALSWIARHDSSLLFIVIPFFIAVIGRIGSKSGFLSAICGAIESLWSRIRPPMKKIVDITVAGPLRKFVKVLFTSDQMLASSLHSKMDVLSSVVVMGSLAFFALSAILFVGFQLHSEAAHLVRLSTSIINSRPDWLSAAKNYTEDKLEDHDIDIDEYVQQGYEQGRAWLASNVRSLAPRDSARADMLEKQVMQIVDKIYKMWEERDSVVPTAATPEGEVRDWKAQLMSITDLRALKQEITLIVKENLDTLMGVVFLTMVYYLLSASRDRWLPIQWFNDMAQLATISDTSSPSTRVGQLRQLRITMSLVPLSKLFCKY